MRSSISAEELARDWSLSFSDLDFVSTKPVASRLDVAVQLKFFASRGHFIESMHDVPDGAANYLAEQLGVARTAISEEDFSRRSGRRHTAEILKYLGFRRMARDDRDVLSSFISTELCPTGMSVGAMVERVFLWCRDQRIFEPYRKVVERLICSERHRFLDEFLGEIANQLLPETVALMRASLEDADSPTGFNTMNGSAGQVSLDSFLAVTDRLAFIQSLRLPRDMLQLPGKSWIEQIVRRVGGEKAFEMRRHTPARQLGLYAVFLMVREAQITDTIIDLLVETVHNHDALETQGR